ncbi:MAG: dTDP-4-dehydrorhamnose 3,5-epimerase [Desulfobacterales bacterium]|nr:dTDP-4-dehydrorhamnose 3,5-epimerase [Desulfobacterales bacterium]
MKINTTSIEGLLILEPDVFRDERGFFLETFHEQKYEELGIESNFVQDNLSLSSKGILRGLHFQYQKPQAKLVQVLLGEVYDVAVDIRQGSTTFGKYFGIMLSQDNLYQMFIPEGFAHGYCVVSETALFAYKCSEFYSPAYEGGLLWSDPDIGIEWPISDPLLSQKDSRLPCLSAFPKDWLTFAI